MSNHQSSYRRHKELDEQFAVALTQYGEARSSEEKYFSRREVLRIRDEMIWHSFDVGTEMTLLATMGIIKKEQDG